MISQDQYGFLYDPYTCLGCGGCQFACREKNDLRPAVWLRRVLHIRGPFFSYSAACSHCDEPACVKACRYHAILKDKETGLVYKVQNRCIGCSSCMWACPYGAVSMNINIGKPIKCNGCIDRVREGKMPACVEACPTQSLRFGRIKDFDCAGARKPEFPFIASAELTKPNVRIQLEEGSRDVQ